MIGTVESPALAAMEDAAIRAAQSLIYSWAEHGFGDGNWIAPDAMPTPPLRSVAHVVWEQVNAGVRSWHNIVPAFEGNQPMQRAFIMCCTEMGFAAEPPHCPRYVETVKGYHLTRRRRELGSDFVLNAADPEKCKSIRAKLDELEADGTGNESLLARAYAAAFDPESIPPPDESCMAIGDVPVAARGNLTALQGKSKVGKSAVVSAILGAAQRGEFHSKADTLCFSWIGNASGAIIHCDTEQSRSDWHALVRRSVARSGLPGVSDRLVSIPLVMFTRGERMAILEGSLEREAKGKGGIDAVIIDGIADLCASPNDEAEALELVSRVHALAQKYECAVFCILHENPGTDQGKTRGHLGSELNRKAFANLRIDKDAETGISTIYGTDMRKRDLPREQGYCFAWDDESGMHTYQGRAAGLKAAMQEAKTVAAAREYWEPLFAHASEIGTNGACPELSPKLAAEIERDISGTEKATKEPAMKKRMQRAESLGVLRKAGAGTWKLNPIGTIGT